VREDLGAQCLELPVERGEVQRHRIPLAPARRLEGAMARSRPTCLGAVVEDDERDRVSCPEHGRLGAWLVVDLAGSVVAAGRAFRSQGRGSKGVEGAAWVPPGVWLPMPWSSAA
jgi:hypothetical protein